MAVMGSRGGRCGLQGWVGVGMSRWAAMGVGGGGGSRRSVCGVGDDVGYGIWWEWLGGDEGNGWRVGLGGSHRGGQRGDGASPVPWFPHLLILAVTLTGTNERHTLTGKTALPHASPRLTFA